MLSEPLGGEGQFRWLDRAGQSETLHSAALAIGADLSTALARLKAFDALLAPREGTGISLVGYVFARVAEDASRAFYEGWAACAKAGGGLDDRENHPRLDAGMAAADGQVRAFGEWFVETIEQMRGEALTEAATLWQAFRAFSESSLNASPRQVLDEFPPADVVLRLEAAHANAEELTKCKEALDRLWEVNNPGSPH